jgi:hypothetical protein
LALCVVQRGRKNRSLLVADNNGQTSILDRDGYEVIDPQRTAVPGRAKLCVERFT